MEAEIREVRQDRITIKNILKVPLYFARGVKFHAAWRIYAPKPVSVCLNVTRRCNSRCVMCSDWKRQDSDRDLTLTEIREIFRNPLFDSMENFSLNGGEPTMREDLVEIAQTVLDSCPQIKEMSLFTNGLEPTIVVEKVQGILALPNYKSLSKLTVSISIDGYGDIHQKIRRFPQAFERATETIKRLKQLQRKTPFHLCSTCVVQPLNLGNLVRLAKFGKELGLPISFIPVWVSESYVEDIASGPPLRFTHQDLAKLKILLDQQMQPNLPLSNAISWREYFKIVDGEKRRLPCFLTHQYAGVDSDGALYMCAADSSSVYGNVRDEPPDKIWYSQKAKEIRKRVEKYSCPKCTVCCNTAFSLQKEFFYYAKFLLKERSRKLWGK